MVVGLGAAVLQGADVATQALDLWFKTLADPRIQAAARGAGSVVATRTDPPMIAGEGLERIDLVSHCDGLASFDREYANAMDFPLTDFSLKVLPLKRIIASKRAARRAKDLAALAALRAALAARQFTDKRPPLIRAQVDLSVPREVPGD